MSTNFCDRCGKTSSKTPCDQCIREEIEYIEAEGRRRLEEVAEQDRKNLEWAKANGK